MSRQMFTLEKRYADVVGSGRRTVIAYWTELRWGPAAVRWEGVSMHEPGRQPIHRWAVGHGVEPRRRPVTGAADGITDLEWESRPLGSEVRCVPWTRPFTARLFETQHGAVDWHCEAPAATVSVSRLGLTGVGYAERLTLTLPPWMLPISELRWGRWSSPALRRSVVWIDWRGAQPLTVVLVDGERAPDASVEDGTVRVGDERLVLTDTALLHSRRIGEALEGLGPLLDRLPASWRAVEDRKFLSRGSLGSADGWAIHETVRFP